MGVRTQLSFWLSSASPRGVGGRRATSCAAPASIEPLEGRRLLAASPPVASAPDPVDLPADLAVGEGLPATWRS